MGCCRLLTAKQQNTAEGKRIKEELEDKLHYNDPFSTPENKKASEKGSRLERVLLFQGFCKKDSAFCFIIMWILRIQLLSGS